MAPRPSLKAYYMRRLTRIEPPYAISILLLFATGLAVYGGQHSAKLANLFAGLIYQHNLIYGEPSAINGVAWSLEIEVQFYLLAPLLATVFSLSNRKWRRCLLTGAILVAGLLTAYFPPRLVSHYDCLLWRLDYFLAGFLLADIFLADLHEVPSRSLAWDLASLFAWPTLVAVLMVKPRFAPLPLIVLCAYWAHFAGGSRNGSSADLFSSLSGACVTPFTWSISASFGPPDGQFAGQ